MLPLLFLHGALGTQAQFDSLLPLLPSGRLYHTLDFEGHGSAERPARPFAITHFAGNVLNMLDAQRIGQVDIFGYSMGGYVGLYLAQTQPERVGSVFTLATKFAWTPESAAAEVRFLDADKMLAKVPHYAAALQQQHGGDWRVVLEKTAALLTDLGARPLLTAETLADIRQPVCIAVGDRDTLVSITESHTTSQALPNGALHVLPNTPHPFEKVSLPLLVDALRHFFWPLTTL